MKNKIKKVLLFIPSAFTFKNYIDINPLPPLGLAYLGAVLEKRGIEVKIVDSLIEGWHNRTEISENVIRIGLSFGEIKEIIRNYNPDMVGINNLFTMQRVNAHRIYEIAKNIDHEVITVAGGAHPTVLPEMVLSDNNVDFVVMGEGEKTIIDLIDVIEDKKNISTLNGIGYRINGEIKILPRTKFIEDLDKLPMPARYLLNMEKYFGLRDSHGRRRKKKFSPIITSRGCPVRCTFCSAHQVWGRKFRYRSAENVIAEMKHIKDKYGIEELMFEDDNATLNVKRAEKIFDLMISEKLDFVWDTPNGISAFTLNEKIIYKMKKSGCYKLNLAVESGNQYVLDNIIKKPLKIDKLRQIVKYAQQIKLDVGLFFVIGMPGETEKQIWDSFNLATELKIFDPFISIATPYPGTELYEICKEKKYISDNFSLDNLYIKSFSISTEDWDREKLKKIYLKGQKSLYVSYIKSHPFNFLFKVLIKFFTNPIRLIKRLYEFITDYEYFIGMRQF